MAPAMGNVPGLGHPGGLRQAKKGLQLVAETMSYGWSVGLQEAFL